MRLSTDEISNSIRDALMEFSKLTNVSEENVNAYADSIIAEQVAILVQKSLNLEPGNIIRKKNLELFGSKENKTPILNIETIKVLHGDRIVC